MRAMIERRDPPRKSPDRPACSYHLFSLQNKPNLYCAVPDDRPVPGFLTSPGWEFRGPTDEIALGALRARAAASGVRLNGFFLFFSLDDHGRVCAPRGGQQQHSCNRLQPAA